MKTIKYIILDLNISNSFNIDTKEINSSDDLIEQFASELQIKPDDFEIENPPDTKNWNSIDEDHEFKLNIKSSCYDLTFRFPSRKTIKVKKGNSLTFSEIIEKFQYNHIYFSQKCQKKNLHFKILDNDITESRFPLKKVPPSFIVDVILTGDYIKLEYEEKEYTFSEHELVFEAIELIKYSFSKLANFSIKNKIKNFNYDSNHKLTKSEKYSIDIKCSFYFIHKTMKELNSHQILDLKTKVSDIKELFASIYCDDRSLKAKSIIIYDKENNEVENDDIYLRDLEDNYGQITFNILDYDPTRLLRKPLTDDKKTTVERKIEKTTVERKIEKTTVERKIEKTTVERKIEKTTVERNDDEPKSEKSKYIKKIKKPVLTKVMTSSEIFDLNQKQKSDVDINFIVDEPQIKSFSEKVSRETTILELSKFICGKFNINKKISIKYKDGNSYCDIDRDMTIDDVIEDIKVKTSKGKYKNVLFIDILSEEKQKNKQTKKNENKNENIKLNPQQDEEESKNDDDNDKNDEVNDDDKNDDDDDYEEEEVVKPKQKSVKGKYKYYYQTNNNDEVKEIELKEGTRVKQFKEIIGEENEVENLADIKVIFAGKDLLNDIILDELNIGDTILFIYIRTVQDILLMTAKALQFNTEEEEEEEKDD